MISVIGIGNAASAIAEKFSGMGNYEVYSLNNNVARNSKFKVRLKSLSDPEAYEENIPNLEKVFANIRERVQVFVMGSSMSSNYTLGILEQIKDKKIDLFYIRPDIELLTRVPQILERITFGVLQEYARSGLFSSITLISNLKLEEALGEVPIKNHYEMLNEFIFSTVHYLNYFEFSEPEIGQVAKPADIHRIRTLGMLDIDSLEEKWLFDLDNPRELCYYICINEERLATEGGLHKQLVDTLKEKPKNTFRKISYAIYETEHEDFGFCVAHTNAIQENTLDKEEQE